MWTRRGLVTAIGGAAGLAALPRLAGAAQQGRVYVNRIGLVGSRVAVWVMVKGQGPFLFGLDSGAPMGVVDEAFAKRLKLARGRARFVTGVGGTSKLYGYIVRDLVLSGGIGLAEMELSGVPEGVLGNGIMGMLGSGAFTIFDSVLDFDRGEWRIHRDGPADRAGFVRAESELSSGDPADRAAAHIYATAELDGTRYRFVVDTGAPGEVSLSWKAAQRSGLWSDERPWAPQRAVGLGGMAAMGRIVRAASFTIAGIAFERPIVLLRAPDGDVDRNIDGIIGLRVLQRLNLATDIAGRALWVQRNRLPRPPNNYGYSGLWLDRRGGELVVEAVGAGSPAQAAGILAGDRLPGKDPDLLVAALRGDPGTRLPLTVVRGGTTRAVTLTLKDYL